MRLQSSTYLRQLCFTRWKLIWTLASVPAQCMQCLFQTSHKLQYVLNTFSVCMCWLQDSCEAADDSVLDLVDYCHRKLALLASRASRDDTPTKDRLSHIESGDSSSIQVQGGLFFTGAVWVPATTLESGHCKSGWWIYFGQWCGL